LILALDPATTSGVAFGKPGDTPSFRTWRLKGENRGVKGVAFLGFMRDLLDEVEPERVFIESPMGIIAATKKGGIPPETILLLNGLVMLAETACASRRVPCELLDRNRAVFHFCGRKPKVAGTAKAMCQSRARLLGWPVQTLDEADAAALWDLGCCLANPRAQVQAMIDRPLRRAI